MGPSLNVRCETRVSHTCLKRAVIWEVSRFSGRPSVSPLSHVRPRWAHFGMGSFPHHRHFARRRSRVSPAFRASELPTWASSTSALSSQELRRQWPRLERRLESTRPVQPSR